MTATRDDEAGSAERRWRREARRVALRVNAGSWLETWLPWGSGLTVAASLGLLAMRRAGGSSTAVLFAWLLALAASASLVVWRLRGSFESEAGALVRLESELRLNTRLSAAAAGVGDWPAAASDYRLRWRPDRIAPAAGLPALLLLAALAVPVSPRPAPPAPQAPPMAWQRVEEWIEQLEERDVVDEQSLEAWRERVDDLRATPPEQWYDHASLEAGDALEARLGSAIAELGSGLEAAARGVGALDVEAPDAALLEALREQLGALQNAELTLDRELAEALARAGSDAARELTSSDIDDLERRLEEGAAACRALGDPCPPGTPGCVPAWGGTGAPTRGPGAAPLAWADAAPQSLDPRLEGIEPSSPDAGRAALGDLISTTRLEHRVEDGDYGGAVASGGASRGDGGAPVWEETLTPREREILRRYFR